MSDKRLGVMRSITSYLSDDPVAQAVLAVLLAVLSLSVVIAVIVAGTRPLLRRLRAYLGWEDELWRAALRIGRWVIALALAFLPGQPLSDLPWLATAAVGITSAEGAESVWGWTKTIVRLAGGRVTSLVRGREG